MNCKVSPMLSISAWNINVHSAQFQKEAKKKTRFGGKIDLLEIGENVLDFKIKEIEWDQTKCCFLFVFFRQNTQSRSEKAD